MLIESQMLGVVGVKSMMFQQEAGVIITIITIQNNTNVTVGVETIHLVIAREGGGLIILILRHCGDHHDWLCHASGALIINLYNTTNTS